MTLEIEQKFRVADRSALRRRLVDAGARFENPVSQADTYFAHPARDFATTDETLRIRSIGEENRVTYKGPKQPHAVKTRCEIELTFAPGPAAAEQLAELLSLLGFRPVATVCKRREEATLDWQGEEVNIALDSVDALGEFCEIELCVEESQTAVAQNLVQSLAGRLDLTDIERRSYLGMFLANEPR
ncbi:MAG: class IV adenylate cyclase [Pirellulales bacterium]